MSVILKKYFSEQSYYFIIFVMISILYITNGYASLATNDDWALRGMLLAKGIYGTLIMSYPLSYVISHLYDFWPTYQWYSVLLSFVMGLNFYFISQYIAKNDSYIQKILLLILSLLWMTFLWFNMSITILTITTMITAVGLIKRNLLLSFAFILLAALLRTDMMMISMPYYIVSFFILREQLFFSKKEILGFILLVLLVIASLFIQKQDQFYNNWLSFNKARSAIADMGILKEGKKNLSSGEKACIERSWWQDETLFSSRKLIKTTPSLKDILAINIKKIDLVPLVNNYKFRHWLWLLLMISVLMMLLNFKNRRILFIPLFALGVLLLLITRDVERVTVPMIMLWAYVLFESFRLYRIPNTVFLGIFTYIFYYYVSGQLGYKYFKEHTVLKNEAHQLLAKTNKTCEPSIIFPTGFSNEVRMVFMANFLFDENNWLQLNDTEILPSGWLSRNKFFYITHNISDLETQRKYSNYYEYLIDDKTAFFGSKLLLHDKSFKVPLLEVYDKLYLKDKPNCKHKTFIINKSEHFAISQIRIDCNATQTK